MYAVLEAVRQFLFVSSYNFAITQDFQFSKTSRQPSQHSTGNLLLPVKAGTMLLSTLTY